jgi:filamentous hemagglutinin
MLQTVHKLERQKYRATFDSEGKLPQDTKLPLLNQGQKPTCGPHSCGMVLDTLIPDRKVTQLGGLTGTEKRVVTIDELATTLNANGLNATYKRRLSIEQLKKSTNSSNPAIVAIDTPNGGHAVVVDGFTTKYGKNVVSIRNPHGEAYFQTVDEFKKVYLKQGVILD